MGAGEQTVLTIMGSILLWAPRVHKDSGPHKIIMELKILTT